MAYKTRATGDNLTRKLWSKECQEEAPRQSFWLSRFSGQKFLDTNGLDIKELRNKHYIQAGAESLLDQSGPDSVIAVFTDLQEAIGDRLTVGSAFQIDEASGQTEGGTLEGNEADLDDTSYNITLAEYRNGVARRGKLANRRSFVSFESQALPKLKQWMATKIDNVINTVALAAPTEIYYPTATGVALTGTSATASAALTATTLLTPNVIMTLVAAADTGRNQQRNKFTRVVIGGSGYYVLLVSPDVCGDMLRNSEWINIANSAWQGKGSDHPLLKNAICTYQNVIIHPYEKCPLYTNGGAGGTIAYSRGIFMGAGALSFCFGQMQPGIVTQEKDYGYIHGMEIDHIFGCAKPTITDNVSAFTFDDNSFSVYTTRTQRSDITLA